MTRLFLLFPVFFFLAACGTPNTAVQKGDPNVKPETSLEAPLYSKGGSAVRGEVTISQHDDTWRLSVSLHAAMPDERFRVAFFDNGNCSSPNAFSAGKLWAPPDTPSDVDPGTWIPLIHSDFNGEANIVSLRLPNPGRHSLEVFRKKSVLIFQRRDVQVLKPGVKNDVAACGVFNTPASLLEDLL
jgi:hypothetical protein